MSGQKPRRRVRAGVAFAVGQNAGETRARAGRGVDRDAPAMQQAGVTAGEEIDHARATATGPIRCASGASGRFDIGRFRVAMKNAA